MHPIHTYYYGLPINCLIIFGCCETCCLVCTYYKSSDWLLFVSFQNGSTVLIEAAGSANDELVRDLIKRGAKVDESDNVSVSTI